MQKQHLVQTIRNPTGEADLYLRLGLERGCSSDDINLRYEGRRRFIDNTKHTMTATDYEARTRALKEARDILLDPKKRRAYDAAHPEAGKRDSGLDYVVQPGEHIHSATIEPTRNLVLRALTDEEIEEEKKRMKRR